MLAVESSKGLQMFQCLVQRRGWGTIRQVGEELFEADAHRHQKTSVKADTDQRMAGHFREAFTAHFVQLAARVQAEHHSSAADVFGSV